MKMKGDVGYWYRPPEVVLNPDSPFDGEKVDIFQAAFVLIALYTLKTLSKNSENVEQCQTKYYNDFRKNGNLDDFWDYCELSPTDNLQNLLAGMLQYDPVKRFTIKQVLDHDWFKGAEPGPAEIKTRTE